MTRNTETLAAYEKPSQPTYAEHHVPRDKGNLYVRDYKGTAPAFVLMHGFPDNLHIYDYLVPELVAAGRRVVTFDFMGFGQSDKTGEASYSFQQQLGDLKAIVDYLKLEKIVPVAHDSSGAAAINFALDHSERTESLVILNAAFAESPSAIWPELITLFATPALQRLSAKLLQAPEQFGWIINFQREQFGKVLSERHTERYNLFLRPAIDANFQKQGSAPAFAQMTSQFFAELKRNGTRIDQLKSLDIPVKVIWGENDPYLTADLAREFQSYFKQASLHLISAGHWVQIDEPTIVSKEMLS